jgi:hypothetical protein
VEKDGKKGVGENGKTYCLPSSIKICIFVSPKFISKAKKWEIRMAE